MAFRKGWSSNILGFRFCLYLQPWIRKTFWNTGWDLFCCYTVPELGILQDHRFQLWHGGTPHSSHQQSPGLALQKAEWRALLHKAAKGLQCSVDAMSTSNILLFLQIQQSSEISPHLIYTTVHLTYLASEASPGVYSASQGHQDRQLWSPNKDLAWKNQITKD